MAMAPHRYTASSTPEWMTRRCATSHSATTHMTMPPNSHGEGNGASMPANMPVAINPSTNPRQRASQVVVFHGPPYQPVHQRSQRRIAQRQHQPAFFLHGGTRDDHAVDSFSRARKLNSSTTAPITVIRPMVEVSPTSRNSNASSQINPMVL